MSTPSSSSSPCSSERSSASSSSTISVTSKVQVEMKKKIPARPRARGRDGRFLPKGVEQPEFDDEPKVCGWCGATETTQWRIGSTSGSTDVGTLCNACGINYRRALKMYPDLDLDKLSKQVPAATATGARASIQKSIKRQRKKNMALSTAKKGSESKQQSWLSVILCLDHCDHEPLSSTSEEMITEPATMLSTTTSNAVPVPFRPTIQNLLC